MSLGHVYTHIHRYLPPDAASRSASRLLSVGALPENEESINFPTALRTLHRRATTAGHLRVCGCHEAPSTVVAGAKAAKCDWCVLSAAATAVGGGFVWIETLTFKNRHTETETHTTRHTRTNTNTHMYTHRHTRTHSHAHTNTHKHTQRQTCTHSHTYTHIHMHKLIN